MDYLRRLIKNPSPRHVLLSCVIVIAFAAILLLLIGRVPWYSHGPIRLWSGNVNSDQNSQQIADPYTFTHLIHGIGFYLLLRLVAKNLPVAARGILAIALEAAWEVFENTDFVIGRYRAATISLNYYGDSVINSVGDILTAALGVYIAAKLPIWATILLVIAIEVILALWIRDSLILNIVMLIYPIQVIKNWQQA